MTDMVEKVARAIWQQERKAKAHDEPFRLSWYEDAARAAIEAMREPTPDMLSAHKRARLQGPVAAHRAMIDAALSATPRQSRP